MSETRLLVTVEKDFTQPALSEAIEETIIRAMQKKEDLPQTLFLNKMSYAAMMLMTFCKKENINLVACQTYGVKVIRCALEPRDTGVIYRDKDMWECHLYDYVKNVSKDFESNRQLFSKVPIDLFRRLGINASLRPINNLMVNQRKIAWSDVQFIGNAFHYDFNVLQDFPFNLVPNLYLILPENLPTRQRMTTLKEELGRQVSDKEVVDGVKASFETVLNTKLIIGELTTLEKTILADVIKKYATEQWNLYGDILIQKAWLIRKCIARGAQTRYCPQRCPTYSQCTLAENKLDFCKSQAASLPFDFETLRLNEM